MATSDAQWLRLLEPWLRAVGACLTEAGWDVQVDPSENSLSSDTLPRSQVGAFKQDSARCETLAGPKPKAPPMTRERVAAIYRYQAGTLRNCLLARGYSVPDPPSEAVFVDDYLSGRPDWHPYDGLPRDLSPAEWKKLEKECPQLPT